MRRVIKYLNQHGICVILPFLCYSLYTQMLAKNCNDIQQCLFGIIFYIILLLSVFYFVFYHTEKIREHTNNGNGRIKFLAHTLGIVIFLSLTFAAYFWCLYHYNSSNFVNVFDKNNFLNYFDFLYYSFGVFIMNNTSNIQANSIYAKLFVSTEMLTAFVTLVLILANYKDLKGTSNNE